MMMVMMDERTKPKTLRLASPARGPVSMKFPCPQPPPTNSHVKPTCPSPYFCVFPTRVFSLLSIVFFFSVVATRRGTIIDARMAPDTAQMTNCR